MSLLTALTVTLPITTFKINTKSHYRILSAPAPATLPSASPIRRRIMESHRTWDDLSGGPCDRSERTVASPLLTLLLPCWSTKPALAGGPHCWGLSSLQRPGPLCSPPTRNCQIFRVYTRPASVQPETPGLLKLRPASGLGCPPLAFQGAMVRQTKGPAHPLTWGRGAQQGNTLAGQGGNAGSGIRIRSLGLSCFLPVLPQRPGSLSAGSPFTASEKAPRRGKAHPPRAPPRAEGLNRIDLDSGRISRGSFTTPEHLRSSPYKEQSRF